MAWTVNAHQFATDLLHRLGAPVSAGNLAVLLAWQRAEGGSARFNPFNTTLGLGGSTNYNSVGVRNYGSYQQGLNATVQTLQNGYYGSIVAGLRHGESPYQTAAAIGHSPWGTSGQLVASVLRGMGNFSALGAGSTAPHPLYPRRAIIRFANNQIGDPYVWGAAGPNAFDCSGLVYAAYRNAGYRGVGRTTYELIKQGIGVSEAHLQPGDLVFPTAGHVGIYIGHGQVISAPHTGANVHQVPLASFGFMAARRLIGGGGGIIPPRGIAGRSPSGLPVAGQGISPQQIAAWTMSQNALAMQGARAQAKANLSTLKPLPIQNLLPQQQAAQAQPQQPDLAQAATDANQASYSAISGDAWKKAGL